MNLGWVYGLFVALYLCKQSEWICVCVDVVAYKCSHAFVLAGGSVSVLLPAVAQYHLMKNSIQMEIRARVCVRTAYVEWMERYYGRDDFGIARCHKQSDITYCTWSTSHPMLWVESIPCHWNVQLNQLTIAFCRLFHSVPMQTIVSNLLGHWVFGWLAH